MFCLSSKNDFKIFCEDKFLIPSLLLLISLMMNPEEFQFSEETITYDR